MTQPADNLPVNHDHLPTVAACPRPCGRWPIHPPSDADPRSDPPGPFVGLRPPHPLRGRPSWTPSPRACCAEYRTGPHYHPPLSGRRRTGPASGRAGCGGGCAAMHRASGPAARRYSLRSAPLRAGSCLAAFGGWGRFRPPPSPLRWGGGLAAVLQAPPPLRSHYVRPHRRLSPPHPRPSRAGRRLRRRWWASPPRPPARGRCPRTPAPPSPLFGYNPLHADRLC